MARAFQRRRDGRIEVNLSEQGRHYLRQEFERIHATLSDTSSTALPILRQPIDPSRDDDDPLRTLERDHAVSSSVELALVTVDEEFLNDAEAWAWAASIGLVLQGLAAHHNLHTDDDVNAADPNVTADLHAVQALLWDLSRALV